jgi:ribonuclease-3 family protein
MEDKMTEINKEINLFQFPPSKSPQLLNPIVLAYIGDAVFEVFIRQFVISKPNHKPHHLHHLTTQYVSAKAQAKILKDIMPILHEEEMYVVRRGRNAKSNTIPKSAEVLDYRHSTAFECLIGYLYYMQEYDRLQEILNLSIAQIQTN